MAEFSTSTGTCVDQRLELRTDELDDARFVEPDEAVTLLPDTIAPRVPAALKARTTLATAYLFGGVERERFGSSSAG